MSQLQLLRQRLAGLLCHRQPFGHSSTLEENTVTPDVMTASDRSGVSVSISGQCVDQRSVCRSEVSVSIRGVDLIRGQCVDQRSVCRSGVREHADSV